MKSFLNYFIFILITGVLTACAFPGNPGWPPPYRPPSVGDPNQPTLPIPPINPDASVQVRTNSFLYDLTLDTIMTTTCEGHINVGGAPFTLMAGAYFREGLQLSEDFKESNNITRRTDDQRVRQLVESSPFKNAQAQLSLATEDAPDRVFSFGGVAQRGYFPIFNNPSTLDLLSDLKKVFTNRSSNNRNVQHGGRFRASLPLRGGTFVYNAPNLLAGASGNMLLTLTYTLDPRTGTLVRDPNNLPYGRSYKLDFENPYKADYLTGVTEEDLPSTKRQGRWTCLEDLRFMILRATDRKDVPFNRDWPRYKHAIPEEAHLDEAYCDLKDHRLSSVERNFFELEFGTDDLRALPFEVGDTVVIRKKEDGSEEEVRKGPCIKFRQQGCYPSQNFFRLEADPDKINDCVRIQKVASSYRSHENPEFYKICPAFLSVCYRR